MGNTTTMQDTILESCELTRQQSIDARRAAEQAVERAKRTIERSRAIRDALPRTPTKTHSPF